MGRAQWSAGACLWISEAGEPHAHGGGSGELCHRCARSWPGFGSSLLSSLKYVIVCSFLSLRMLIDSLGIVDLGLLSALLLTICTGPDYIANMGLNIGLDMVSE